MSIDSEWLPTGEAHFDATNGGIGAAMPSDRTRFDNPAEVPREPLAAGPEAASDPPAEGGNDPERQPEPDQEADLTGRLRLAASEHDCRLVSLSVAGMTVFAPAAVVAVGQQVAVITQELPRLIGLVRWVSGEQFGVHFPTPLSEDVIQQTARIRRRVRTHRAKRAKLELPSIVYFDGTRHEVVVGNICAGGLMFTTRSSGKRGQRKLIRDGQALMIEFPELLPVGGYVTWTNGSTCGVMFSRLLSITMAEEIARLGALSETWLDDVRLAHAEYEGTSLSPIERRERPRS